jgi:hypothetical protein
LPFASFLDRLTLEVKAKSLQVKKTVTA